MKKQRVVALVKAALSELNAGSDPVSTAKQVKDRLVRIGFQPSGYKRGSTIKMWLKPSGSFKWSDVASAVSDLGGKLGKDVLGDPEVAGPGFHIRANEVGVFVEAFRKRSDTTVDAASAPAGQTFLGSVVKTRFGLVVILESKMGRKYREFKWASLDKPGQVGWIKVRIGTQDAEAFRQYPFVRKATPSEMKGGGSALNEHRAKKAERHSKAIDKIVTDEIKPGDVVEVRYSDGRKKEAVLEVDYRAGKIAIVRQYQSSAELSTKRRMIPVSLVTKIADGGGKFDPNNPLYTQHHIHIPEFYKQGGKVAKRAPKKPRWEW